MAPPPPRSVEKPIPTRPSFPALGPDEVLLPLPGAPARAIPASDVDAARDLVVDLSDGWSPFLFADRSSPSEPAKPNGYRATFLDLANERADPTGAPLPPGQHLYLEPFGIPPTLSVLAARFEEALTPARQACLAAVDEDALRAFQDQPPVAFLDRKTALREWREALDDETWARRLAETPDAGASGPLAKPSAPASGSDRDLLPEEVERLLSGATPKTRPRLLRWKAGRARLRAVRALQARLRCEGLLVEKVSPGEYDLPTHEALAIWERKNDVFGWGILGGETLTALLRPPRELEAEAFDRFLAERVADAAGIVEDGSAARADVAATFKDRQGATLPVPNLVATHVAALKEALSVATPEDVVAFLRQARPLAAHLLVAIRRPALPPYYEAPMSLEVEIDRGDVFYDFVFDRKGKPINQPREHYPHLTLFVRWNDQRIPLVDWRTTIGSWRSEKAANGFVYYRYKNSDVGPRLWKNIVAGPTWIPPDGTLPQDLLVRRVHDRQKGAELEVNTGVMGPGFQSAYGLAMAIHVTAGGADNQIRTHGSVDYTSIARRFSHGCHRLVNNRAVRLFDFVLRRQPTKRLGQMPLALHRQFSYQGRAFDYRLATRGYYYELVHPIPVNVLEGRIKGQAQRPLAALMRKPGVSYAGAEEPASGDATADVAAIGGHRSDEGAKGPGASEPTGEPLPLDSSAAGAPSATAPHPPDEPPPEPASAVQVGEPAAAHAAARAREGRNRQRPPGGGEGDEGERAEPAPAAPPPAAPRERESDP